MNGMRQGGGVIPVGVAIVLLAVLTAAAAAQDAPMALPSGDTGPAPTLVVDSDPPGAVVILRGAYEWTGLTPWRLYREATGLYRVEVRLAGYETWSGEVVLGTGNTCQLQVRLGKRTMAKALLRSTLIPGWGQMYRGQKVKGTLLALSSVLAAGGVVWTHEAYRNDVDDFESARRAFERETRWEDWPARYERVRRAAEKADEGYDHRQIALAALGGVYALNLLDCLLFAPASDVSSSGYTAGVAPREGSDTGTIDWLADVSPASGVRAGLRLRWN